MTETTEDRNAIEKTKVCRDCGNEFGLTVGELSWLRDKFGDSFSEPSRCRECRTARKEKRAM